MKIAYPRPKQSKYGPPPNEGRRPWNRHSCRHPTQVSGNESQMTTQNWALEDLEHWSKLPCLFKLIFKLQPQKMTIPDKIATKRHFIIPFTKICPALTKSGLRGWNSSNIHQKLKHLIKDCPSTPQNFRIPGHCSLQFYKDHADFRIAKPWRQPISRAWKSVCPSTQANPYNKPKLRFEFQPQNPPSSLLFHLRASWHPCCKTGNFQRIGTHLFIFQTKAFWQVPSLKIS